MIVMADKYLSAQNAQARFIVERLKRAMPLLSGALRSNAPDARIALHGLERVLAAYDSIKPQGGS